MRDILFVHLNGFHVNIDGDKIDMREIYILVTARDKDNDLANVLHQLFILRLHFLIVLLLLRSIDFVVLIVDCRCLLILTDCFLSLLSDFDSEFLLL